MKRQLWIGLIIGGLAGLGLGAMRQSRVAAAQQAGAEAQWVYKVGVVSYNPGERLTDERRAAAYERTLNEQARLGWEPVGTLLTRDTVQTVGGAVTTRDTTSFVAYRRRR
jgi:hypothetical protein